jgi:CBS domain-containing protein
MKYIITDNIGNNMELKARDIMINDPVTAAPDEIIASAKLKMERQGLGGLPVVEHGKLVGIITHRDTILTGKRSLKIKVKDIMTRDVLTIKKDTDFYEIAAVMKKTGYQRLPVTKGKKLVGLVTQSCVINALVK